MTAVLRHLSTLAVAAVLVAAPSVVKAQIIGRATTTMPVSVQPLSGCEVSATPMVFVMLPPYTNQQVQSSATISVRCTPQTNFTIDIDNGLYPQGGGKRRMFNPSSGDYFTYDIYKDVPRTDRWGTGNPKNYSGNSGSSGVVDLTVYGLTESATKLTAGNYSDTLTITVTF